MKAAGAPNMSPRPKNENEDVRPDIGRPFVACRAIPRAMLRRASVATIAGTRRIAIKAPLMIPMDVPVANPIKAPKKGPPPLAYYDNLFDLQRIYRRGAKILFGLGRRPATISDKVYRRSARIACQTVEMECIDRKR
jgi:hypothetical protein